MHRRRATISLLLVVLLISSAVAPAFAATSADLLKHQKAADAARDKARAAESAAKRLAGEVEDLDSQIEEIEAAAEALEPKIAEAARRTARIQAEVDDLKTEVSRTSRQIAKTEAAYEHQQALLANRVEETYRQGDWFYLDVLLGSTDISDLITRTEFVSRVISSNNSLAAGLEQTQDSLERAKVKLDRSLESVKIKKREAAQVENRLRALKAERDRAAANAEAMQAQKSSLVAENKKNAKRLRALADAEEAESARIAAELSGSRGSGKYGGIMAWPVPSSQRITSPFGYRTHPIFGDRRLHTGIDIGASQGSAIVSAGTGTVSYVGYRGGYGNTVIIDHGNGVSTLYAHQANGAIRVSSGQRVSKGQQIGGVGSTGYSTGPHLHFEVRVNGEPRNPMSYM